MKFPGVIFSIVFLTIYISGSPLPELNHTTRNYDQIHIALHLSFDFEKKQVHGISEFTFTPLTEGFALLRLHSKTTSVKSVTLRNKKLKFDSDDEYLSITMDKKYSSRDTLTLTIAYTSLPERGMFFFSPSKEFPSMPYQIWTQGQADNNRYWYPAYDLPDDKLTSEIILTVPQKFTTSSNGVLQDTLRDDKGNMIWRWEMGKPYSNYLTSVIVGEYAVVTEELENTRLEHYFPPDWNTENLSYIYGRTAHMLSFFNRLMVPYPYKRYAQIPVQDFEWGGMENITATTLNRRIYHDNCVKPNYSADGLIAHELAHQWFGDLLTCRDWNHIWLNEGFATYYTTLWEENYHGYDGYIASHMSNQRDYMGQWLGNIITATDSTKKAKIPVDLIGGNAYDKGASILNMIRYELGADLYNKAVADYVKQYRNSSVISDQFKDALPEIPHVNWDAFFDQWVYGSGFPELEIRYSYDANNRKVKIWVNQTPSFGSSLEFFIMNLPGEILTADGTFPFTLSITGKSAEFELASHLKPEAVTFNTHSAVLCAYDAVYTFEELVYILNYSADASARIYAASQLHKFDNRGTSFLAYALKNDKNFLVKKEIILSLDKINNIHSLRALFAGLEDHDGRIRESAAKAIGAFGVIIQASGAGKEVENLLKTKLNTECNHYVLGGLLESYGKLKFEDSFELLKGYALSPSHLDAIRSGVFRGLAGFEQDELFDLAIKALDYNISAGDMHLGDITILEWAAKLYPKHPEKVKRVILEGLKNPYFRTRIKAANLVAELEIVSLEGELNSLLKTERRIVVKQPVTRAIEKLRKANK
ncbi:MAG: hypothetical protein AMXMBFR48_18710 [Ignavibacteriales bacterium]